MKALLTASLCFSLFGWAADKAVDLEELKRPVLSATGRQRLEENIRLLETTLRDLRENLTASDKNLATLNAEQKDLNDLEREHLALKKKYENYLAHASQELVQNEKARRDLAKWETSTQNLSKDKVDPVLQDKLEAARVEQADREKWKNDAEAKTAKVKNLLTGIQRNLADIRSRKAPIQEQLTLWQTKRADYKKQIDSTESKKAEWEKLLVR